MLLSINYEISIYFTYIKFGAFYAL